MTTVPPAISRKESVFFELTCSIQELHDLHNELSLQDLKELKLASTKLQYLIGNQLLQPQSVYPLTV